MSPLIHHELIAWVGNHPLLKGLPREALKPLVLALDEVCRAKGESIYNELETPGQLWMLKKGCVRLVRHSSTGHIFAFHVVTPGGVFCIPGLMNQCPYPCRAIADTDSVLVKMPASVFYQLLGRYPAFGREALRLVARECCRAHALCSASQERVEQRLLGVLLELVDAFGPTIPLSRQQVAELAGMSRETANRVLLHLQKQGVVRLAFRRLSVPSPAQLRSWVERHG